jgi:hypothetical protein
MRVVIPIYLISDLTGLKRVCDLFRYTLKDLPDDDLLSKHVAVTSFGYNQ